VIALSITPGVARPGDNAFVWLIVSTPAPLQKLMHVVVYATLALLWMWTLASVESRAVRITLVILITVGLGAILEWHQTRVPGRFGTVFDVLLNIIGTLIGIIAAFLIM
jgi:VanZ family protein